MMNVSWLDWAGGYTIHNISTAANCGPGQLGLLPRTLPNTVSYYIDQFCCIYLSSVHKCKVRQSKAK